tara:strand:- start:60 stop:293 length:234 start_codon:yes stop_codon:yes gene_type:complete
MATGFAVWLFLEGLAIDDPMLHAVKAVTPWCASMMVLYSLAMILDHDFDDGTPTVWFWIFVGVLSALIVKATSKREW